MEDHLGLLLLRKLFANRCHPNSYVWCVTPQFFLPSQQDLVENTKMHGDARTTSDHERLMQFLHTRVLQMIIYFLWADATGKPANSQLILKQCQAVHSIFWRLISKTCCSCPLLGPTNSILPQSGSDFLQCSSLDDTVWGTNIRIDTSLYRIKTLAEFFNLVSGLL